MKDRKCIERTLLEEGKSMILIARRRNWYLYRISDKWYRYGKVDFGWWWRRIWVGKRIYNLFVQVEWGMISLVFFLAVEGRNGFLLCSRMSHFHEQDKYHTLFRPPLRFFYFLTDAFSVVTIERLECDLLNLQRFLSNFIFWHLHSHSPLFPLIFITNQNRTGEISSFKLTHPGWLARGFFFLCDLGCWDGRRLLPSFVDIYETAYIFTVHHLESSISKNTYLLRNLWPGSWESRWINITKCESVTLKRDSLKSLDPLLFFILLNRVLQTLWVGLQSLDRSRKPMSCSPRIHQSQLDSPAPQPHDDLLFILTLIYSILWFF